ncbi:MAG: caspase family protein [Saprospiraceae bacterium]|nr:caspase family protein [Saprospiraceae bacterium]
MKRLLITLATIIPFFLAAQPSKTPLWDDIIGTNNSNVLSKVIEATNGNIAAVGEVHGGGKNGLFVLYDFSTGTQLKRKSYGGKKDDVLQSIVQTADGHFILAGYSASFNAKAAGWLIKVDEKGNEIWQQDLGTGAENRFYELVMLQDQSLVACGIKDGRLWMYKFDSDGKKIWDKTLVAVPMGTVQGMQVNAKNEIFVTGNTVKSGDTRKDNIYVVKTDASGKHIWGHEYGEKGWEEAQDLIITADGSVVVVGNTINGGFGKIDMLLLKINALSGTQQWSATFGGREDDLASSVIETFSGEFVVVGKTYSHARGARDSNVRLVGVGRGGDRLWEVDPGKEKDDEGRHILQLHDESLLFVGRTNQRENGAWVTRLAALKPPTLISAKGEFNIARTKFWLKTADGYLQPNSRSYVSFNITNQESFDLDNVSVRLVDQSQNQEISYWANTYLGPLKRGETREVRIPVSAKQIAETSDNRFGVTVLSSNQPISAFTEVIKTKNPRPATLVIAKDFVRPEGNTEFSPRNITLEVENKGDQVANGGKVIINAPEGIQVLGGRELPLGQILPRALKRLNIRVQKKAQFEGTSTVIECVIIDAQGKRTRKNINVSFDVYVAADGFEDILFTSPNEAKMNIKRVTSDRANFRIEATISTAQGNLSPQDARVRINGRTPDNSKMDEENLQPPTQRAGKFRYAYENVLPLEEGENRITIEFKTDNGILQSRELIVNYTPRKPNLHVLSIGIPHQDLKYTTNDAKDFASMFQNQAGKDKTYERAFVESLYSAEQTRKTPIYAAFADLQRRYRNENREDQIKDDDVLIVFISSHGKEDNGSFKILASDYHLYPTAAMIDYQKEVLEILEGIECKKFVFIDACHSGAAEGGRESSIQVRRALEKINNAYPGLNVITSSQQDQLSYEDDQWQNGAFTEATMEAFNNTLCTDDSGSYLADTDSNKYITFDELYDFLKKRVRGLVKTIKGKDQMPKKNENESGGDYPIFILH